MLLGRASKDTLVREIMISPPVTVSARCQIAEAMRTMTFHRVRHLPVVRDDGSVVGLVSIGDLVNWIVTSQDRAIEQLESYIQGQDRI
jgi:CBS domain-containing protein